MAVGNGMRLTDENTNAWGHRMVGDTLVYECADCEWGEVVVTEMIEEEAAQCPDCGATYRLTVERVDDE